MHEMTTWEIQSENQGDTSSIDAFSPSCGPELKDWGPRRKSLLISSSTPFDFKL